MGFKKDPATPFLVTHWRGGVHFALATVGAVPSTHPKIPAWNPFAYNDTKYRNIILVGQDADAEYLFLRQNPHFNPYPFGTVTAVLDCQRLYGMLHPGTGPQNLKSLIRYCFPEVDVELLDLHNAVSLFLRFLPLVNITNSGNRATTLTGSSTSVCIY